MSSFLRTLIFTILVPGFWTVAMPYWLLPRGTRLDLHGAGAAGILFIAVGIAIYFACAFWGFALRDKGTPAIFDPPKKLVEEGPYRIVRNPMYWSVALVMFGEGLVFHSLVLVEVALAFFVATILFVRFYEEPHLKKVFGGQYEEYCRRVPRWFPRFKSKLD
jgi:protein-S-isoprenylcysteine O-methyltransferase Ste14